MPDVPVSDNLSARDDDERADNESVAGHESAQFSAAGDADSEPPNNVASHFSAGREADIPQPPQRQGLSLAQQALAARGQAQPPAFSLDSLNPQQRQAVETTEGPVLVLAGAGTGKTRVLTTRIAYILARHLAFPSQILAVTFTNKAAAEMKERIANLAGEAVQAMPWLGTFHSLGARLLRIHAELVGLKSDFTILDTDDTKRLLKQLIRSEGLDDKRWPARLLAQSIDEWKNKGWTPDKIPEGDARAFGDGKGRILYQAYQERLKTTNSCDFGDLLLLPIALFRQNPDVLEKYQRKFRYILVDEYQDTNVAQYLWLRLLAQRPAGESVNLCCVGDDDQSIYGWRGAEIDNILRFEKDFKNTVIIRLECNYRSTAPILATASYLISHNKGRLGKTLFTDSAADDAAKVQLRAAWDSQEEARAIGDEIESLNRGGEKLNDIAILVRAGFQTREFEERFDVIGLNYRIIGGLRFYERQEIRDAIAYLRLVVNPTADMSFERIFNLPKRGLGDACLAKLHERARADNISLMDAAEYLANGAELKPKQRSSLHELVENFHRWRSLLDKKPHTELAQIVLDESGYTAMLQNDKSADASGRLENLKELIHSLESFENLRGFLEHIELVMDKDGQNREDAVSIMTLHSAKGLEFNTIFLPGWEEGLFPHQRALDEGGRKGLEEERRLAYVGLTRARKREYIWFSQNRRIHGMWQNTMPSRFLDELPSDYIDVTLGDNNFGGYAAPCRGAGAGAGGNGGLSGGVFKTPDAFGGDYQTPGFRRGKQNANEATRNNWGRRSGANIENVYYGDAEARYSRASESGAERQRSGRDSGAPILEGQVIRREIHNAGEGGSREGRAFDKAGRVLAVGDRVFHIKYGYGKITAADNDKLTVSFDKAGEKRLFASYVEKA